MTGYARGFDISDNNGEFDFAAYPGMDFAFFKACELTGAGMHYDAQFPRNMAASLEFYGKRFVRHAYGFVHPGESVAVQAETLVQLGKDHGLIPGDHYMMDLEVNDGLPPAEVARFGRAFSHAVNVLAPGHRCICYTYPYFAEQGNCEGLWPWRLFIANYLVSAPTVPDPWAAHGLSWKYWQFAAGRAATSFGPDLDVFNGDQAALWEFSRMPADRR